MIGLLWLLVSCDHPDPHQVVLHSAVAAWQEGAAALEAGDPPAAREAFARALVARPGDALLMSWDARAAAEAGDLDAAIALLQEVVGTQPDFGEAHYNLAAYLARTGEPEAAAEALQAAVGLGVRPADEILDDPDFIQYLGHPAFAFLPAAALLIAVDGPAGSAFWGSQVAVVFRVSGGGDHPVQVQGEGASGPVEIVSVVEDLRQSSSGPSRDITWTFKVVGAGPVDLGPFRVTSGARESAVKSLHFEALAPEGKEEPKTPLAPISFATPSQVGGDLAEPSAEFRGDALLIKARIADRIEVLPVPPGQRMHYELREGGQPLWQIHKFWDFAVPPERVEIVRAGETIFDAAPRK